MNSARKTPDTDALSPALADEGSCVRQRAERQESERPSSPARARRSDPCISLDQRMESKLGAASALLAKLEPQDARARLLQIAVLRRDEALLDGILAELTTPATSRRLR